MVPSFDFLFFIVDIVSMGSAQTCITQQVQMPNAQGVYKTHILIGLS
jgi:hypothetical protein